MSEDKQLFVTMTPEAAEKFKSALRWANSMLTPDEYPARSEKDQVAHDHCGWLEWGCSRVQFAESEENQ